ncbi:MurR/RpiR family transcriptional regulator [Enterococcus faecalis]
MLLKERMNEHFQGLNPNERQVLLKVLDNQSAYNHLTIDVFAQKCLVSKSFVIRLCKKLGFSGYSEFKFQLKAEVAASDIKQTATAIFDLAHQDLLETQRLLSPTSVNELCRLLDQAPHIYTYGTGYGQKTILEDFKRGLISNQRAVTALPTSVELRLNSAIMNEDDLLFIVSMSGRVDSIMNELVYLKDKGVVVVSITEFTSNPLASIASINFYLKSTPVVNPLAPGNPYTSYAPLCMLLDLIAKNYLTYPKT